MKLEYLSPVMVLAVVVFFMWPIFATGVAYLGNYEDEGIEIGSEEWVQWHEDKIALSGCAEKETLNTIDVCCGYVTTFCKKRWSWAYEWTEYHSMFNTYHWKWRWE